MGTEINLNQYVTAASFSASKTSGGKRNEKTERNSSIRKKFSEILHKSDSELEIDSYLPAEIAGMSFDDALSFLLDNVTMSADNLKRNPFKATSCRSKLQSALPSYP